MFSDACNIFYAHSCALTPFSDSALSFAAEVRILSHSDHPPCML